MSDLLRMAVVEITPELIRDLLGFPKNSRVVQWQVNDNDFGRRTLSALLECEEFPPVPEGQMFPRLSPVIGSLPCGHGELIRWGHPGIKAPKTHKELKAELNELREGLNS